MHDAAGAEDIAQEAFLAAVRALDRFDSGRPFGPWLHRIVVNRAIDWARGRALRREVGAGEAIEDAAAEERGDPTAPLSEDVVAASPRSRPTTAPSSSSAMSSSTRPVRSHGCCSFPGAR